MMGGFPKRSRQRQILFAQLHSLHELVYTEQARCQIIRII